MLLLRFLALVLIAAGCALADVSALLSVALSGQVAVDGEGNLYIADSIHESPESPTNILLLKLDPTGTRILYSRQFGGSGFDHVAAMKVLPDGSVFLAGTTRSPDFPTTSGAWKETLTGDSAGFVAAFDPAGNPRYVTTTPAEGLDALAVTAGGEAIISGRYRDPNRLGEVTLDLPPSSDQYSPLYYYVTRLDSTGANAIFTAKGIGGRLLAVDERGDIYVAGSTETPAFPSTPGAYQPGIEFTVCGYTKAFIFPCHHTYVAKLDSTGSQLHYATFITGSLQDSPQALAVDDEGRAHIAVTSQSSDYPATPGAVDWGRGACVTRLAPDGSALEWSACLGEVLIGALSVEADGSVVVGGEAVVDPYFDLPGGVCLFDFATDAPFAARLSPDGSQLVGLRSFNDRDASVFGASASNGEIVLIGRPGREDPYRDRLELDIPAGEGSTFVVSLNPDQAVPASRVACLRDATDFEPLAAVVPGQLIALFGSGLGPDPGVVSEPSGGRLPEEQSGVQVTFDGEPAPILYASESQVNIAIPLTLASRLASQMRVTVDREPVAEKILPVLDRAPSAFGGFPDGCQDLFETAGGASGGPLNEDGTLNTCNNRARPGSVVSLYLNGLGAAAQQLPAGAISPASPPEIDLPVVVWNDNLTIESATAAPLQPSGVWLIKLRLPDPYLSGREFFSLTIDGAPVRQDPFIIWVAPPE